MKYNNHEALEVLRSESDYTISKVIDIFRDPKHSLTYVVIFEEDDGESTACIVYLESKDFEEVDLEDAIRWRKKYHSGSADFTTANFI